MADASKIEWTDATWNPLRGCSRIAEGCRLFCRVMPRDVAPWPTKSVEPVQRRATPTCALDERIVFSGKSSIKARGPFGGTMVGYGWENLQILWSVVGLVAVYVVYLLSLFQGPTKHLLCNETMFVDVSPNVCKVVPRDPNDNVAVRRHALSALPVWVLVPWMYDTHTFRVTYCSPIL